ncbi:MAG: hypothetical protein ACKOYM_04325, partial [Actinomycetes bacterium]
MPVPLAVTATVIADVSVFGLATSRQHRPRALTALAFIAAADLCWVLTGANAPTVGLLVLALASVALRWWRPTMLGPAEAAATGAARSLWSGSAHTVRAIATPDRRWIWITGLVVTAISAPIFWRISADPRVNIRGTNDLRSAVPRIDWIRLWPPRSSLAHPTYFVVIKLLRPAVGWVAATTAVAAVATGAASAVLVSVARGLWDRRRSLPWVGAVTFGLAGALLENPAVLIPRTTDIWGRFSAAGQFARGTSYLPLHQWATPTIVAS